MSSRALSLATVMLLIGCLSAGSARAQNLEAGKSPSQIFSNTCTACHKSPRGLLRTVSASSLPGFLRQHYTTSSEMAGVLSSYLISNGANDQRYQAKDQPKGARDGRREAKQSPEQADHPEQASRRQRQGAVQPDAAKPDADGVMPQGEGRPGRKGRRLARPSEAPEGAKSDGQTPEAAGEEVKHGARHKHGRRGRPVEEQKPDDAAKGETPKDEPKAETAKTDAGAKTEDKGETEKPVIAKPTSDGSDSAKVDAPKEGAASESAPMRADPIPPVTPAATSTPAASPTPSASSAVAAPEPAASASPAPVTAAAPPLPPVPSGAPAGPPEAPLSK